MLVLGGGDGLAAREVLRYAGRRSVTVVELDPGVVRLARTRPGALRAQRARLPRPAGAGVTRGRLPLAARRPRGAYDVVISDLPDPGITPSTKLYSQEFYGLAARVWPPAGGSPCTPGAPAPRPRAFWTVDATLRAAGLRTAPYRVTAVARLRRRPRPPAAPPRDWGFVLATARRADAPHRPRYRARASTHRPRRGRPRRAGAPAVPRLRALRAEGRMGRRVDRVVWAGMGQVEPRARAGCEGCAGACGCVGRKEQYAVRVRWCRLGRLGFHGA